MGRTRSTPSGKLSLVNGPKQKIGLAIGICSNFIALQVVNVLQEAEPSANTLPDEDARLHSQAVQALEKLHNLRPDHLEGLIVGASPLSSAGKLSRSIFLLARGLWLSIHACRLSHIAAPVSQLVSMHRSCTTVLVWPNHKTISGL